MVYKVKFSCGCFSIYSGGLDAFRHKVYGCPLGVRGNKKHENCQEVERIIIE